MTWPQIVQEAGFNNEGESEYRGSFYGRRIADLAEQNPYYYARLESDRACSLGMVVAYLCEREPRCETSERMEGSEGNLGTHMSGEERAAFKRTVVGLQYARTVDHRTYVAEVKGLHLNVPNDLFNGFARRLITAQGKVMLHSPPERDQVLELHSSWAHIEGRVGVVGVYGADQLVVHRSPQRRGGKYRSLYVEEICLHCALG